MTFVLLEFVPFRTVYHLHRVDFDANTKPYWVLQGRNAGLASNLPFVLCEKSASPIHSVFVSVTYQPLVSFEVLIRELMRGVLITSLINENTLSNLHQYLENFTTQGWAKTQIYFQQIQLLFTGDC
jgi:hypothetical protein